MRKRTWLAVFILVVVVVGSTLGATSVFAHEPTPDDAGDWRGDMAAHCPGMSGGWGMGYHGVADPVTLERVAGTLGLTYDELAARLTQGETVAQVAEAQGVNPSLVVATILAPESEILEVRVKYGYLTEAQAEAILEQARYWVEQAIAAPQYGYDSSTTSPTTGGYNQQHAPNYGWRGRGGGMMGGGMMGGGMMGGGMMGGW